MLLKMKDALGSFGKFVFVHSSGGWTGWGWRGGRFPAESGPVTPCGSPNCAKFSCATAISGLAMMLGSIVRIGFAFSVFTIGARNCLSFRGGRLPILAAVFARIRSEE